MVLPSAMRMAAAASRAISTSPAAKSTYTGGFDVFNQQSRILVTGGTGQIGALLSLSLSELVGPLHATLTPLAAVLRHGAGPVPA